jgi:hypothetical protein
VALVRTDVSEKELLILISMLQSLVAVNVVPSSLILFTLMMKAIRSSETLVLIRAIRRYIPEDGISQKLSCPVRN